MPSQRCRIIACFNPPGGSRYLGTAATLIDWSLSARFNPPGGSRYLGTEPQELLTLTSHGFNPPGGSRYLGTSWLPPWQDDDPIVSIRRADHDTWEPQARPHNQRHMPVSIRRADHYAWELTNFARSRNIRNEFQSAGRITMPGNIMTQPCTCGRHHDGFQSAGRITMPGNSQSSATRNPDQSFNPPGGSLCLGTLLIVRSDVWSEYLTFQSAGRITWATWESPRAACLGRASDRGNVFQSAGRITMPGNISLEA